MCNTEQQKEKIAEWMFQAIREYYMKKCTFPNDKLHHPELAGKPMAVGGDPEARHGIVLTANYIAKRAGVKTGMALWQARQVCPEIIFVPPRMDLYYILVSVNGEQSDISTTKTGSTKIYNAKDIVEAGRIIELLKEQGIVAFSQEAGASVAMHGAPRFGMYGVDVLVEGDEAKKAIQIIEAADDSQNKEKF